MNASFVYHRLIPIAEPGWVEILTVTCSRPRLVPLGTTHTSLKPLKSSGMVTSVSSNPICGLSTVN